MISKRSARACRALIVIPAIAACQQVMANSGIQVPLSQYQAGSEHTTLVPNGNFSSRADNDNDGTFETATGWNTITIDPALGMKVDTTINPPSNSAATSPFSAQAYVINSANQPSVESSTRYDQPVNKASFATNTNYVVSAYMYNFGRGRT